MKKVLSLSLILAITILGRFGIADELTGFQTLCEGVEYRHEIQSVDPQSIYVLRIDRQKKWDLQAGLGQGTVYGLESLDGIVRRTVSATKKSAITAINGDFFVIKPGPYRGDPTGLQITQGELVSRPTGNSFWIAPDGELKIGLAESKLRVVWPDGKSKTSLRLNEDRADDEAALYTPSLGLRSNETPQEWPTTRTVGGAELVLERVESERWLPIQAGKTYPAKIAKIREGGDSPLQFDKIILSIGPKLSVPSLNVGDVLQLAMETSPNLEGVKTAVGAGRILVKDGTMPDLGPADQPRHPRSMVGWNKRHLFFVVVDGRLPEISIGMTYPEMAELMKKYGCIEAVELDGGGSSTLWAMGKIFNSPSDGRTRAIANALILFRREISNLAEQSPQ
jgi:hypothetical protein